jgi:4-aminobutyrate aminotransferase-like enzyme
MDNVRPEKKDAMSLRRTRPGRLCPFVSKPYDECFCSDTGSDSAEAAIRLCGGNYEICEIYRRRRWEHETGPP